jgi:hypothetical protein
MVFAILSLKAINTAYKPGPLSDVNLEVHAMLSIRGGNAASSLKFNLIQFRVAKQEWQTKDLYCLNQPTHPKPLENMQNNK